MSKDTIDTIHPNTTYGLQVHKAMEDLGKDGTPLPSGMEPHQKTADIVARLVAHGDHAEFENKMGVTKDGLACGFFDPNVYGRAIADVMITYESEKTVLIYDFKLGKYRGKTNQAVINAHHVFALMPEIETVRTVFDYMVADVKDRGYWKRSEHQKNFAPVKSLINQLEDSVAYENFPTKKNGLCKSYCGAYACPHNGNYRATRASPVAPEPYVAPTLVI